MKFLFDENISHRILKKIVTVYSGSEHVSNVRTKQWKDAQIWEYAQGNDFIIVTYDSDFNEFSMLKGHPPKVIWLRLGNQLTMDVAATLISLKEDIRAFENHAHQSVFEIRTVIKKDN